MTTIMHIKTDKSLKERAESIAKANGLTLTAFVNISIRQIINTGNITLEEPLEFNKKTQKELDKRLKDVKAGKNLSPVFNKMEDAIRYLGLEK
mgnify:CR=1 FL=1